MDKDIYTNIMDIDKKAKEIAVYNFLHKVDEKSNYSVKYKKNNLDDKNGLSKYINETYDKITDEDIKKTALRCMSLNDMRRIILRYELINYKEKSKKMSLKKFAKKAKMILDRYTRKAGGFYLEDSEWILHTHTSQDYNIKKHEVLFENSIDETDIVDRDFKKFAKLIINRLGSLFKEIKIDYRYEHLKNGIVMQLIWCTHKGMKKTPEISL